MSTERKVPNSTHLFGHLRAEFPAAAGTRVQVRNVDKPKRRFFVGVTDGVNFSLLGEPGGYTTETAARQVAESFTQKVA